MYFPGHIAGPYLASRTLHADTRIAIVAGLLPDVVDKLGSYVLRISPDGRVPAHTFLGLATTLSIAWLVGLLVGRPRRVAYAWGLGYATHLVLDLVNGNVPVLWPFMHYEFAEYMSPLQRWLRIPPWRIALTLGVEIAISLVAFAVWRRRAHSTRPGRSCRGELICYNDSITQGTVRLPDK